MKRIPTTGEALENIIRAWEKPHNDPMMRGEYMSPCAMEAWLRDDMTPAVNAAREVLGLKHGAFIKENP